MRRLKWIEMGAGAGVDLRTRSKQMSSVDWVVVTSALS